MVFWIFVSNEVYLKEIWRTKHLTKPGDKRKVVANGDFYFPVVIFPSNVNEDKNLRT